MEYGTAYLRPASKIDDSDSASILSEHRISQHQAFGQHDLQAPHTTLPPRNSWNISPAALQQSLPPMMPANESTSNMRPTIYGSRAILDFNYQEPVAWANSTNFRAPSSDSQKLEQQSMPMSGSESSHVNLSRDKRQYFRHPRHMAEPWKAGFWISFPWWGFGALFTITLLTCASTGILLASDGSTPENWKVGDDNAQPFVYVSIFEMIMICLILFAFVEGMVIKFWCELLHGSTLSALHDIYESAFLWPAFRRILRLQFNIVAIACILIATSFLRGPILQRSLAVRDNGTFNSTAGVNLNIAPWPIPEYFQSAAKSDQYLQGSITTLFSRSLRGVSAGTPLNIQTPPKCERYCTGKVKAFSFKAECSTDSRPLNLSSFFSDCRTCSNPKCTTDCTARAQNEFNAPFFSVRHQSSEKGQSLNLETIYKNQASCSGAIQIHTCSLTPVTAENSFSITDGGIDLLSVGANIQTNISENVFPVAPSLMQKYWPAAIEALFPSVAVNVTPTGDYSRLRYQKCIGNEKTSTCTDGSTLQATLIANDASVMYANLPQAPEQQDPLCGLTWRDPMPDLIYKMQALAFRITVDMANTNDPTFTNSIAGPDFADLRKTWIQAVQVRTSHTRMVYKTDKILVAIGVTLSIISIAAVVPLYNGFWKLGRKVSLNPLEIAKAFAAPMLEGMDGNVSAEMVTVERGGMVVRYGVVERYGEGKTLRVEESARATVRMPWQGEVFG
ncbi:hypothetical protein B0J11DRAFT_577572 [Dendryphion nanum]|uniref:Uncharacterized protein n=1 Tax=Dendryphion nanum TaxID=256645 RepID=A0A9P9E765_9PLEO|nr:hypothetical protein B0J11DRAFT_577572 [Dendryphion nanum]